MATPSSPAVAQADTLALARELVARPSITPDDAGCLGIVESRLGALGFVCERIARGGVTNLWARHGDVAPLVCFAGHVDVVPAGPEAEWTVPPFSAVVRDGFLFGRGAADMKGSVAAMVTAVERIVRADAAHPGSVALVLTSDEEGDALHGTAAVVDVLRLRGVTLDHCVVGEPTSAQRFGDTMKNGRRGSLSAVLRVRGIQGHVAYPERGRNPVHQAAPALAELAATVWDQGSDDFGPTTFQMSNIHAGTGAPNVVPGSLEVQFNLRFSPASPADRLKARVAALLERHGLDYELQWTLNAEPFVTPVGTLVEAVRRTVEVTTGERPALSTSGGTSDGRFLAAIAREVVEFGPMNDTIHQIDERVAVADLGVLSTIYEGTARTLLGM
ncbi:MAG TPA: succinyl-diaminopimelate desuccinylase [Vicinamibacterales bacterium]|nr:succinyl-diaminopimelate desuccinylase [Vicinamibacterales bacterium]